MPSETVAIVPLPFLSSTLIATIFGASQLDVTVVRGNARRHTDVASSTFLRSSFSNTALVCSSRT